MNSNPQIKAYVQAKVVEGKISQDRATFQELAKARLAEATLLLESGLPSGAYYLAGYAIECELKAVIAAGFRANEIPDKSRVNSIYTHNLKDLLSLAGLKIPLEDEMNENSGLRESWATISKVVRARAL